MMALPGRRDAWNLLLRVVFPLLAIALLLGSEHGQGALPVAGDRGLLVLALLSYGLSHVLRALRLAVLSASILRVRVRMLFLLHFHTAVVSAALPFKLGELYRLHELAALSGNGGRALLAVLVERAFDAIVLLFLCGGLLLAGPATLPADMRAIALLLAFALGVSLFVLFVAEPQLAAFQAYVFTRHISPPARLVLMAVCSFRQGIAVARRCVKGNFLLLLLMSAAIWTCEAVTLAAVVPTLGGEAGSFLIDNVALVLSSQEALINQPYGLVVAGLLLPWPVVTFFYVRRLSRWRVAAPAAVPPLSYSLQSRRLRRHVPRRVSCHSN